MEASAKSLEEKFKKKKCEAHVVMVATQKVRSRCYSRCNSMAMRIIKFPKRMVCKFLKK